GKATAIYFAQEGWNVAATMRRQAIKHTSDFDPYPSIAIFELDVTNCESIKAAISDTLQKFSQIDVLYNNAGYALAGAFEATTDEQVRRQFETNLFGTLTLCEVMAHNAVKNLVFSSSATVYGLPDKVPVNEDAPLSCTNPYGRTKLMSEQVLQDLCTADKEWSVVMLRYFNPVGAHPSGLIGESPRSVPNNLVPYIAQVAAGKLDELRIYGGDYPTPDGTGVRDYIHIVDLALGHLKALQILENPGAHAYNLGTGRGYSVLEVLAEFSRACGKTIPYSIVERRPGDVATSYADASKAQHDMDWRAERGLAEMCDDTWRWQSQNPDGYPS
ncbi:MAG: UDP-glucose 4-epimerase GalE, partial [Proteobacteria bacterium]